MSVELSVTLDVSAWREMIATMAEALALDRVFASAAAVVRQDLLQQFQQGGDPAWTPLQPATVNAKARAGYPRKSRDGSIPPNMEQDGSWGAESVLLMTGALMTSYTQRNAPGHVELVEGDTLVIGSDLVYAATHQCGDDRLAWGRVHAHYPARPLRIRSQAVEAIAKLIQDEWAGGGA